MKATGSTDSTTEYIIVSNQDYERLSLLLQHAGGANVELLEEELSRAHIVPQKEMPGDVVTMNSRVQFLDEESNRLSEVTLTYPKDADIAKMKVSILAPIGMALIGLKLGQSIRWPLPNGKVRRLKINSIIYQPEANENWEL